ncbi:MAG: hypothetical protein AAFV49_02720 [Pseudomonadota bacterium]
MEDQASPCAGTSTAERVEALFTRSDGAFRFARWGRALAPAYFGIDPGGEYLFREALGAVTGLGGLDLVDEDPELGANALHFFCRDWSELRAVPGLDRLVPDRDRLLTVLAASGANQYRIFGFEPDSAGAPGAIRIAITLIRYDADLGRLPAQVLAMSQCVQSLLLWSDHAFTAESPVAESPTAVLKAGGRSIVKPWYQALIRAAYDPALPCATDNAAHAGRIAARMPAAGI